MASNNTEKNGEAVDSPIAIETPVIGKQPTLEIVETKSSERIKATRHPRWTRQETLVLIEAKKMVENGEQLFRFKSSSGLLNNSDPKWEIVSSCCQQQGVKRGSVQCRKRWGNLLTDFRKIKKWESTSLKDEGESFWIMRNDKRKENKLPGFFDEVVYRVLDGEVLSAAALPLSLIKMPSKPENGVGHVGGIALEQCKDDDDNDDDEDDENEAIVDSDKMSWSTEENIFETNSAGNKLFSPIKTPASNGTFLRGSLKITPTLALPTPEKQQHPSCQGNYDPGWQREAMFQEGHKRKRTSTTPENSEDETNLSNNIMKVLRRNTNIMKAYLGAQNINQQLARDQQKEQSENLVAALGKLTDAITKIADKL